MLHEESTGHGDDREATIEFDASSLSFHESAATANANPSNSESRGECGDYIEQEGRLPIHSASASPRRATPGTSPRRERDFDRESVLSQHSQAQDNLIAIMNTVHGALHNITLQVSELKGDVERRMTRLDDDLRSLQRDVKDIKEKQDAAGTGELDLSGLSSVLVECAKDAVEQYAASVEARGAPSSVPPGIGHSKSTPSSSSSIGEAASGTRNGPASGTANIRPHPTLSLSPY